MSLGLPSVPLVLTKLLNSCQGSVIMCTLPCTNFSPCFQTHIVHGCFKWYLSSPPSEFFNSYPQALPILSFFSCQALCLITTTVFQRVAHQTSPPEGPRKRKLVFSLDLGRLCLFPTLHTDQLKAIWHSQREVILKEKMPIQNGKFFLLSRPPFHHIRSLTDPCTRPPTSARWCVPSR